MNKSIFILRGVVLLALLICLKPAVSQSFSSEESDGFFSCSGSVSNDGSISISCTCEQILRDPFNPDGQYTKSTIGEETYELSKVEKEYVLKKLHTALDWMVINEEHKKEFRSDLDMSPISWNKSDVHGSSWRQFTLSFQAYSDGSSVVTLTIDLQPHLVLHGLPSLTEPISKEDYFLFKSTESLKDFVQFMSQEFPSDIEELFKE